MRKLQTKLKRVLSAWLRQPKDEMDMRQTKNDIQSLLPPENSG